MDTAARQPLLKVEHLKQYFKVNKTFTVKAVDDISFEIFPGETYPVRANPPRGAASYACMTQPAAPLSLTAKISPAG